jgi:hypothetical protein
MSTIPLDVLYILIHYVDFDTVISLSRTSKIFHAFVRERSKYLTKRVLSALTTLDIFPVSEFCDSLNASSAVVSGGFLLSLWLQNFEPGDLDIFVQASSFADTNYPDPSSTRQRHRPYLPIEEFLWKHGKVLYKSGHRCDFKTEKADAAYMQPDKQNKTFYVRNFYLGPKAFKVQIIYVEGSVDEHIMNFDFDVLRSTFDGRSIIVNDINAICTREITPLVRDGVKLRHNLSEAARATKYRSRGFNFVDEYRPSVYGTKRSSKRAKKTNVVDDDDAFYGPR